MLFNSYSFLFIYLPIVLLGFFGIGAKWGRRPAVLFLFLASLVFYSIWDVTVLPLLLVSILFNFVVARGIEKAQDSRRKAFLLFGVVVNLLLLVYYKYSFFFVSTIADVFGFSWGGFESPVLPIGISFYTFTQIAYLVDTWRGDARRDDLPTYGLFVTFFPHLVAGPILHHKKIIPQFRDSAFLAFSHVNMARGIVFLALGLGKKLLIADRLAFWANPVFADAMNAGFMDAWVGALSYALQLYFDFSGYSDMAVGLALMLNVEIPLNFNSPYKAVSIIDFWRRWHISLSQFLRDYLYIPLGGNRFGEARRYLNLLITMVLGGLWHGAGFTFLFWGAWHGAFLALNHLWQKRNRPLPIAVAWPLTFLTVVLAWVPFRAGSLSEAMALFKSMAGLNGGVFPLAFGTRLVPEMGQAVIAIAVLLVFVAVLPNSQEIAERFQYRRRWAFALAAMTAVSLISLNRVSEFLYFQF